MIKEFDEDMTCVVIKSYNTTFWRYQSEDRSFLATVESIYYFYKEVVEEYKKRGLCDSEEYSNLDDLLIFYSMSFEMIKRSFNNNKNRTVVSTNFTANTTTIE